MPLVIVESPNKIKKIKSILGDDYSVIASVGHIMDLASKDMGIDKCSWEPIYVVNKDKTQVVKKIQIEASLYDDIYIATDSDNEGCAIAHNILSILPSSGKSIYRCIFRTITKKDVLKGIKHPIEFNSKQFEAQKVRRIIDRMVGFQVSPVMWSKGLKKTSAGRVQSSALKIISDRETLIRDFVPVTYWSLKVDAGINVDILNKHKFSLLSEAEAAIRSIGKTLTVKAYKSRVLRKKALPPFDTATLQQVAGTKLKWSGKKIMNIAQSLFSEGMITYHRTDSVRSDPDKTLLARKMILEKYGEDYLPNVSNEFGVKNGTQDAHECIRPTFELIPFGTTSDEINLLDLISDRYLASQMSDAIYEQAVITFESGDESLNLYTSGSIRTFDGFQALYGSLSKDISIPQLIVGQIVKIKSKSKVKHVTKPSSRYNGASLTSKLKKSGIGRPSTYASILESLLSKKYIILKSDKIFVTKIGRIVCEYLSEHFNKLTDEKFTSNMEKILDEVAEGSRLKNSVLSDFNTTLNLDILKASNSNSDKLFYTNRTCSKCDGAHKMVKKISNIGLYLGCESYPRCGNILVINDDGTEFESEVETGTPCPDCKGVLKVRNGKYGEFVVCDNYPVCSWIGSKDPSGSLTKSIIHTSKENKTNLICPTCSVGHIIIRDGQYGKYAACDRYPRCKSKFKIGKNGNINKREVSPTKETSITCSRCKLGKLIERNGKYGKFYGCSEFKNGCKQVLKKL